MAILKLGKISKENGKPVLIRKGYGYGVPVLGVSKHFVAVAISNYNRVDIERKRWDTNKQSSSTAATIYIRAPHNLMNTQCFMKELAEVTKLALSLGLK